MCLNSTHNISRSLIEDIHWHHWHAAHLVVLVGLDPNLQPLEPLEKRKELMPRPLLINHTLQGNANAKNQHLRQVPQPLDMRRTQQHKIVLDEALHDAHVERVRIVLDQRKRQELLHALDNGLRDNSSRRKHHQHVANLEKHVLGADLEPPSLL